MSVRKKSQHPYTMNRIRVAGEYLRALVLHSIIAILVLSASSGCLRAQSYSQDVNWLIKVLDLKEGSRVADIGAGDGGETLAIARHIGEKGHIFSTELGEESVEELREELENADMKNIDVLEAHPTHTNLPEECCDAIYMRRVYHHIAEPSLMNRSLFRTLKPGGKLAVIDFEPRGQEAEAGDRASGSSHGVTLETVVKELQEVGFTILSKEQRSGRNIYVVAQRPEEAEG